MSQDQQRATNDVVGDRPIDAKLRSNAKFLRDCYDDLHSGEADAIAKKLELSAAIACAAAEVLRMRDLKRQIDGAAATKEEREEYRSRKAQAWTNLEAALAGLPVQSETPPLKDGDSWKLRECPHANWSYDEREAWKGGYYAAMCDIGPTLAVRTERGAMSEEDRIAGRHAYPGDD